ncbi:MAG: hypothetical protein ACYDAQ_11900 [Mycobacteriales bacterium]
MLHPPGPETEPVQDSGDRPLLDRLLADLVASFDGCTPGPNGTGCERMAPWC